MNYSSILIAFRPETMTETLDAVKALSGVEVFQVDEEHSRAIAVIEAETTGAEVAMFETIQRLAGVIDVSLVNHYFADEMAADASTEKSE